MRPGWGYGVLAALALFTLSVPKGEQSKGRVRPQWGCSQAAGAGHGSQVAGHVHTANSFGMHSYKKRASKSFGIHSYKIIGLKAL